MKFIWFKGDLGNQVFSCAFYNYLKKKFPHEKIYGCMKGGAGVPLAQERAGSAPSGVGLQVKKKGKI